VPLQELLNLVRARPFVPFRIYITDGSHYDVSHPDAVMAFARSVVVGVGAAAGNGAGVPDHPVIIALVHITRLEPLDAPAQA
jgi:hypothetical protein